ncbi:hypothetical protein [Magnetococcus sp. PR-3]|uniref:hypothetical protein n=1 Tax=Magnetococcus sp. PR-3 TaxID=3120355 RepID=UPI002FCDEDF5
MSVEHIQSVEVTIPAYGRETIHALGQSITVLDSDGTFFMGFDNNEPVRTEAGLSYSLPSAIKKISFENKTNNDVSVWLAVGDGVVQDRRMSFTGTNNVDISGVSVGGGVLPVAVSIGGSVVNTAVSVAASATELVASDESRKEVHVQPTNGDIYIGGASVTATNGLLVKKGVLYVLTLKAAVYAVSVSGGVDVRVMGVS